MFYGMSVPTLLSEFSLAVATFGGWHSNTPNKNQA